MKPKTQARKERRTPSREQVRKSTSPRVNVPRASKRPTERADQKRSRRG
jgi:hypothetical protein